MAVRSLATSLALKEACHCRCFGYNVGLFLFESDIDMLIIHKIISKLRLVVRVGTLSMNEMKWQCDIYTDQF